MFDFTKSLVWPLGECLFVTSEAKEIQLIVFRLILTSLIQK
jgi:hypothetical protein